MEKKLIKVEIERKNEVKYSQYWVSGFTKLELKNGKKLDNVECTLVFEINDTQEKKDVEKIKSDMIDFINELIVENIGMSQLNEMMEEAYNEQGECYFEFDDNENCVTISCSSGIKPRRQIEYMTQRQLDKKISSGQLVEKN